MLRSISVSKLEHCDSKVIWEEMGSNGWLVDWLIDKMVHVANSLKSVETPMFSSETPQK